MDRVARKTWASRAAFLVGAVILGTSLGRTAHAQNVDLRGFAPAASLERPSMLTGAASPSPAKMARLLRREAPYLEVSRDFVIYDEEDQHTLIRQAIKDLGYDPKQVPPGKIQAIISQAKNEMLTPEEIAPGSHLQAIARQVYARYQSALRTNNALDFDDLLTQAARLLREHPEVRDRCRARHRHVLVDELCISIF